MGALGWLSLRLPWALRLGRAGPCTGRAGWGPRAVRGTVGGGCAAQGSVAPQEQAGLQKWLNKPCKSELRKEIPTEKAILEDKCNLRI